MDAKDVKAFVDLTQKIKADNLLIPNMPQDIWYAVHSILALPAVEVLMTRTGKDFLLNYRKDRDFDGWEIPGGFIAYKESLEEACLRIAKREVGLEPKFERVITAEVWKDHPYSSGVSIVCLCKVKGEPVPGQFFTEIPSNMVPHHSGFIKKFLEQ